jgi:hypothetical protein
MYSTHLLNVRRTRISWLALAAIALALVGVVTFASTQVYTLPRQIPVVLLFAILAYINYRLGQRDVLYPGFIFSFLWFCTFALYVFCFVNVDDITLTTDSLLLSGVMAFTLGSYLAMFFPRLKGVMGYLWDVSDSGCGKVIALLWVIVVFPL